MDGLSTVNLLDLILFLYLSLLFPDLPIHIRQHRLSGHFSRGREMRHDDLKWRFVPGH